MLGSLHSVPVGDEFLEPPELFRRWPAERALREYLAELCGMIEVSDAFEVLAHVDFPLRFWPEDARPFDPLDFEDDLRRPLRLLAATDRALELNSTVPLPEDVVRWWREEGGAAVTFGSDAHEPERLGRGLSRLAEVAARHGFRPGGRPEAPWRLPS